MNPSEEKSLLTKWLDGKLSDKEQADVNALPNMDLLTKAVDMVDTFEMPSPNLKKIEHQLDQKRLLKKPKPFIRRFLVPLSAVAAVAIGAIFWFTSNFSVNTYTTAQQEQLAVILPDESTIQLNAVSSISYTEKDWPENRHLSLKGNAYFKVKKGSSFKVETDLGAVQVLGTQFEVLSRGAVFEVLCFEGKVHLTSAQFDTIIVGGQGFVSQPDKQEVFDIEATKPAWISGTLSLREKKLSFVFEELERQYNVDIDYSAIRKTEEFTGTFPLDNLDLSLNIVCTPMGLGYDISSNGSVSITK